MGEMGTYQVFSHDGTDIGGMMGLGNSPVPAWLPYFGANGIDAAIARITAAGGKLAHGPTEVPGGAFIAVAQDPQGAWFAVVGPKDVTSCRAVTPTAVRRHRRGDAASGPSAGRSARESGGRRRGARPPPRRCRRREGLRHRLRQAEARERRGIVGLARGCGRGSPAGLARDLGGEVGEREGLVARRARRPCPAWPSPVSTAAAAVGIVARAARPRSGRRRRRR